MKNFFPYSSTNHIPIFLHFLETYVVHDVPNHNSNTCYCLDCLILWGIVLFIAYYNQYLDSYYGVNTILHFAINRFLLHIIYHTGSKFWTYCIYLITIYICLIIISPYWLWLLLLTTYMTKQFVENREY